jgi:hypothetical protein
MHTLPLIAGAAAAFAVTAKAEPPADNATTTGGSMYWPGLSNLDLAMPWQKLSRDVYERAAGDPLAPYTTNNGKCIDVAGGKAANNAKVQLWDCNGAANQGWRVNGFMLQTDNGQCLDVPDGKGGNGTPLQVYKCDAANGNQNWERVGANIRWYGHNLCVDVPDGQFQNGRPLQLWSCYLGSPNQQFTKGKATVAPTKQTVSAGNFLGFPMIAWPAFVNLHPQISSFADAYVQAGAQNNIAPQLLGAISLQESSGNPNPTNGAGLMQFTDLAAWQRYAAPNAKRSNPWDAVFAGARYMRALLDENNQDLNRALRAYNGPLEWGGKVTYQAEIQAWMKGVMVYGPGT